MYFDKPINMPRGTHYGSNYWEVFSKILLIPVHSMASSYCA